MRRRSSGLKAPVVAADILPVSALSGSATAQIVIGFRPSLTSGFVIYGTEKRNTESAWSIVREFVHDN